MGLRGDTRRLEFEDLVLARLMTHGERFEILVDPELAQEYKTGKDVDIREILEGDIIFEDLHKGLKASEEKLEEIFETTDPFEIAKTIILEGEIHLTAEQRKQRLEEKRKQIIDYIVKNSINPQTKLPHPPARIERAMEETKVAIDPFQNIEEQAKRIVKEIAAQIPIRMEKLQLVVKLPAEFTGKGYGIVSRYANIKKDEWQADGSWIAIIDIPAGLQSALKDEINHLTKGRAQIKILEDTK
jgi:ribosome maturation protein SDO1